MARQLFTVFLALLTVALTAAGLVNSDFALIWWLLAGIAGVLTVTVWLWERNRTRPSPPPQSSASTSGAHSPAIIGDRNTLTYGPPPRRDQQRLDAGLDQLLADGNMLRERPRGERLHALVADTRAWQERCVRSVREHAPDQVEVFKASAGTYQPLVGESGFATKGGNWRRSYDERLERWLRALAELHS